MKKNRMYEIVYSDFKLLNGLKYREIDTIKLTNNDVIMINEIRKLIIVKMIFINFWEFN